MTPRETEASRTEIDGRSSKAEQFQLAAQMVRDLDEGDGALDDAVVTLCVHAGIAAADVLLVRTTGRYSKGASHADAAVALAKVAREPSRALSTLLRMKTRAGYSAQPVQRAQVVAAERAMDLLIRAMRA
ncbi:hypothetical protein [Sanguibacter inulinus]|uniref:HEPN domain-containing protein n=1 Tax=Sanguibacter inulinus TaxID=60922 RepID=A0A853ETC4_9MICO|nr:hypothetical protein [Sanguibacter inulinus]MBF0722606.1 hypothetical protein [Sanguibacter inulinus]NYS93751.1 hypothetical protein [Sanguibacter inulinus]